MLHFNGTGIKESNLDVSVISHVDVSVISNEILNRKCKNITLTTIFVLCDIKAQPREMYLYVQMEKGNANDMVKEECPPIPM